ncbi:MAG: DNA polymerase III subunit delta [Clostridia bacterium]|nr:DNA polymerase III subunit delta [Clostridia bacterium]
MSLKILEDDLKNKKLHNIYLFFGEDVYEIERHLEKIKKSFSNLQLGVNFFQLDKSNLQELPDIVTSFTFFGEDKLVVIKDTKLKINLDVLESVENTKTICVIIEPSVDKRTLEFKKLQKLAICVEFSNLNEKDCVKYVIKTLGQYKIIVDEKTANYMVEVCTSSKQLLINEFKKIVSYLNEGDVLDCETIDKICVRTLDAKIFDVIDLIVAKKKDIALKLIDDLIAQKTYIGVISSLLFKQIKQLYLIKLAEEKQTKERTNAVQELGINPFVLSKLNRAKSMYSKEKLEELVLEFADYDVKSKTGLEDPVLGLKRIVCIM